MPSKFRYTDEAGISEDVTLYRYEDRLLEVPNSMVCPDCRTPVVYVEDDYTVSKTYHDETCPQVLMGRGEVAPRAPFPSQTGEHNDRARQYQEWWADEKLRRGMYW